MHLLGSNFESWWLIRFRLFIPGARMDFLVWYRAQPRVPLSKALVQAYRSHLEEQDLSPSTINVRLAAIRKLAPELAAGIAKVKGVRQRGIRAGNWLEQAQARELLRAPGRSSRKPPW